MSTEDTETREALTGQLPQKTMEVWQENRKEEIAQQQTDYQWVITDAFTPTANGLPSREQTTPGLARAVQVFGSLTGDLVMEIIKKPAYLAKDVFENVFGGLFGSIEDPYSVYTDVMPRHLTWHGVQVELPAVCAHWQSDAEFAAIRLNGPNPYWIKKYTEPLEYFPITDEIVKGLLPEGETLESMTKAGKLYVLDYTYLDGTWVKPEFKGCFAAPITLFGVKDEKLMPLAIKLVKGEGPIFTPNDDTGMWRLAKMYVGCADINTHAYWTHVMSCHYLMEYLYVASRRTISHLHPLYPLIFEHGMLTIVINDMARKTLISKPPIGFATTIYSTGFEGAASICTYTKDTFDFMLLSPRYDMETRGLNECPGNLYREDALKLWDCIFNYVTEVVNEIYASEEDLQGDWEIQAWAAEVVSVHKYKNIPISVKEDGTGYFKDRAEFIFFLTIFINTASVRHGAANSPQFDYNGYSPNHPTSISIPVPTSKDAKFDDEQIARGLPSWRNTASNVSLLLTLSTPESADRVLGQYNASEMLKKVPSLTPMVEKFQQNLKEISQGIKDRNAKVDRPYPYLDHATGSLNAGPLIGVLGLVITAEVKMLSPAAEHGTTISNIGACHEVGGD